MALNAKFLADFSDVQREADKAIAKFEEISAGAEKVGSSVDKMVGKAAADLDRFGKAAGDSAEEINTLHGSVDQVDRVLAAAGVSLGPIPGALKEIEVAAGKTATELGALGIAGAAAAAAMAGWHVGRGAAEFFDLDEKIGNATAKLLGFGDVAEQEAAAKAETLARASEVAGFKVESLATATEIMAGRARDEAQALKDAAEATKQLEKDTKAATAAQKEAIEAEKQRRDRIFDTLKVELDAAKAAQERADADRKAVAEIEGLWRDLAESQAEHSLSSFTAQKLHVENWFQDQVSKLDKLSPHYAEHYRALEAQAKDALNNMKIDWDTLRRFSKEALQEEADVAAATYQEMLLSAHLFTREGLEAQKQKVRETADEARGLGKAFQEAQQQAADATAKATAELAKQREEAEKIAAAQRAQSFSFEVTAANLEENARGFGVDPAIVKAWAKLGYSFQHALDFARRIGMPPPGMPQGPGPRIPGFAQGVENFSGGPAIVGERGPELVELPRGSNVIPFAGKSAGPVVNLYVSGVWDPRSQAELTRVVKAGIVQGMEARGEAFA